MSLLSCQVITKGNGGSTKEPPDMAEVYATVWGMSSVLFWLWGWMGICPRQMSFCGPCSQLLGCDGWCVLGAIGSRSFHIHWVPMATDSINKVLFASESGLQGFHSAPQFLLWLQSRLPWQG